MDTTDSIVRRQNNLGPAYRLFYDEPVHAKSAEGVWIVDVDGKRYLDVYNNVPSVGHAHPGVVAAQRHASADSDGASRADHKRARQS